ncbi:flotillin-2 isoform X1 [Pongo pygmaeus]|uniref:flotillin-2 isoform X1 n=1 Tax=Pongo abelii TaxID=9601 RepID=UPI0023E8E81A|nr:flotillin-2 isoform X1 [Pongo abelii]
MQGWGHLYLESLGIKRVDCRGCARSCLKAPAPPSAATLPAGLRPQRGAGERAAGRWGWRDRLGAAGAADPLLLSGSVRSRGPSVPPAPWAIATRWGPTRRWWFQVKIMTEKELLAVACEQFLGKNVQDIKNVVLQTLEGHLRSILGTLTVEQIYQDRDQFAKLVREVAAPDVGRMGIEILSFTIKDVYDKVDYLSSLGKTQTAVVQRDADIGVAEAERDAGIREAECKKEMLDVKFMADTKIADSKRAFELQKSAFSEEVNIKTAEAQLAYELQGAREQQKIRQEEIEIEVVQRKKQIAVEAQEILRTDKELIATVRRPAEAEAHRIQQIAEGEKVKQVLLAQAEAEKIRKIGEAEAAVIEAMGKAEAERMKLKAEAYQKYGDAAKMALVLEALPQIAAKIAAPLTKVDEIVVLSGDNSKFTSEVNRLLAELPASVHALTGVDLSKIPLIKKATGVQV